MQCLSHAQAKLWLEEIGLGLERDREVSFVNAKFQQVTCTIPCKPLKIAYFASSLVKWLPDGFSRLFLLHEWTTYPLLHSIFFQKLRSADCGTQPIIDAPAHLFMPFVGDDHGFYTKEETATLSGLLLLSICFGWEGYLVSQTGSSFVILGDGYISFASSDAEKISEARSLVSGS